MIETELRNLIVPTSSHIPSIAQRLYIGNLPDSVTYPCAVMYGIARTEIPEARIPVEHIQFSIYGDYISSVTDIADAIRDKVKRFSGAPYSSSSYRIVKTIYNNLSYLYDDQVLKHVKILDMIVQYTT